MSTFLLPCARPVTVTIDLLEGVGFSGCIFSVGLKVSLGCSLQGLVSSVYVMDGTYNSHGIQCTSGYVPSLSNLAPVRSAPDKRWVDKKTLPRGWIVATRTNTRRVQSMRQYVSKYGLVKFKWLLIIPCTCRIGLRAYIHSVWCPNWYGVFYELTPRMFSPIHYRRP